MKKKKTAPVFIIPIPLYRVSVVIYVGASLEGIIVHALKKGVKKENFTEDWKNWIGKEIDGTCGGFCTNLGEKNKDVLVWVREMPKKLSQYATLYHELYHATDHIADSSNFNTEDKMSEPKAYIFEYLFTEISKVLWNKK